MHTIVYLMKKHRLAWLALTERHMKQQDQFIVDGYTFSHGASEELDERGKPKHSQGSRWSLPPTLHLPSLTSLFLMAALFHLWWTQQKLRSQFLQFMLPAMEGRRMLEMIFGPNSQRPFAATREISNSVLSGTSMHRSWMNRHQHQGQWGHISIGRRRAKKRWPRRTRVRASPIMSDFSSSSFKRIFVFHKPGCKRSTSIDSHTPDLLEKRYSWTMSSRPYNGGTSSQTFPQSFRHPPRQGVRDTESKTGKKRKG